MSKKKSFPKYHINPTQEVDYDNTILQDKYEKEYANLLVEMLSTKDTSQLADSVYKLRQLDSKLKEIGYRATVKVGLKRFERSYKCIS